MKINTTPTAIFRVLLPCLLATGALAPSAIAHPELDFTDPPSTPTGTGSGGTRPVFCGHELRQAQAPFGVMQPRNQESLTASSRPDLWVYMPSSHPQQIEFSIVGSQGEEIYQSLLAVPQQKGWVSISYPQAAPSLQLGQKYTWTVALVCDTRDRTRDLTVQTTVHHTPMPFKIPAVQSASTELDVIQQLAKEGFWLDAMSRWSVLQGQSQTIAQPSQRLMPAEPAQQSSLSTPSTPTLLSPISSNRSDAANVSTSH
ncbi:DUF928 domain-containing protein [Alkalinema sp. FACHB-956]|uniref:DUF928 domain-containing protein n=1 Tax=Alkalinema sp. FACHB-956 TaxID=2692768 RepID=UPI001684DA0A|nr:DUF928 domain-containing protein [Alkalinema sp. FACHB-956]MBD2329143.1 DUF928 domain-containing protein [Alkalinema sp. FACHB-956]